MAESTPAPPASAQSGSSRTSRHDMEGLGKFKLSNAASRGNSYKAKFFVLKETYDIVTGRREELRRELEVANARLKTVQAENDLLLDAMQIVAPSQPTLVNILHQMEDLPPSVPASSGTEEIFAGLPRADPAPPPQSSYAASSLPEQQHHPGTIVDAAALNGSSSGNGYTHHAPVHAVNGRTRTREYRERDEQSVDEEMLDDDALLAERQHERERERALPPSGAGTGTNGW